MTYIKQSKAKEMIQSALDAVGKGDASFQMRKPMKLCAIHLDGSKKPTAWGMGWAGAISMLIEKIRPPTPVFDGNGKTLTATIEEIPIEKHPEFHKPQKDIGVIPAWTDEETGFFHPEDRSGYRPEFDGKSMADFWDGKLGRFQDDAPREWIGLTHFLKPVIKES